MLAAVMSVPVAVYLSLLYRVWLVLADALAGLATIKILADTYRQGLKKQA